MACAWASFASNLLMMILSYAIGQKKFPIAIRYKISRYLRHIGGFILCSWDVAPGSILEILRLGYRTVLLLIFLAIIIRRDLPLSELPYIGEKVCI